MQERKNLIAVGSATIKDLAPEEKEKVGELIRRLAQEKTLREEFERKYEEIKQKYEQLQAKYNSQVVKAEDENRFLKLQLKNSLRKLEQSTEHIRQRRLMEPSLTESNPNLRQNVKIEDIKQPQLKESTSPLSKPRTSSKRKEIQELKQQIESLSKGCKIDKVGQSNPLPISPPKATKQSKLQQYELIKSRYENKTIIADDSFQVSPDQPETPTLPEPMTFVKPNQVNVTRIETSIFEDNTEHYSTQKVIKKTEQPIIQTVKKVSESIKSRPAASRICRQGFYSSDLLDLVDSLDK